MTLSRRTLLRTAAAAAVVPASRNAAAQDYPARPVRMIVAFAPGGPTDVYARLIGQKLSQRFGKQFFVENIAGASGNLGTVQAARAAPDGYTILVAVNNHVVNPILFDKVGYDPYKDFTPVTLSVIFPSVLLVHDAVKAADVKELVALIKANPGKYNFASAGVGTPSHLLGEQFRQALGLDLVHIPYNGSGPAAAAALAGHTPLAFAAVAAAAPLVKDGRLRALATMSKHRAAALPQVPTIAEAGYPGLDGDGWIGVLVPARTPAAIVDELYREIARITQAPDIKERLGTLGFDPVGSTPEEFTAQMKLETEKWGKVIRAGNIRP